MADILIHNAFRIFSISLNYLSPSLIADILLHPFDFATVLLQIGFDPDGLKSDATTLFSALAQYALFTFYIPYLFTSMQGVQFMGLPHPSMFYYVSYIYKQEGILGCYRGIIPKICERITMMYTNETIKKTLNKAPLLRSDSDSAESGDHDEKFIQHMINNLCSQFFAVLASHPFHVVMISSFAEFMYERKTSMFRLAQTIYEDDGFHGFFIGLAPRLIGEILSLTFSGIYTGIINKQMRTLPEDVVTQRVGRSSILSYLSDVTRFSAFIPRAKHLGIDNRRSDSNTASRKSQFLAFFNSFLGSITQNLAPRIETRTESTITQQSRSRRRGFSTVLTYLPLTSKYFYYMMVRDYISKKISYPYFMVCNCMIVLDTGWEKLPFVKYISPLMTFIKALIPKKRTPL